jgi:hypothetical protein
LNTDTWPWMSSMVSWSVWLVSLPAVWDSR